MIIFPKLFHTFTGIPIKIAVAYITELSKTFLKLIRKQKKIRGAKTILGNKDKVVSITILVLKLYYKVTVTKSAWAWQRISPEDQWSSREDANAISNILSIDFDKGAKHVH